MPQIEGWRKRREGIWVNRTTRQLMIVGDEGSGMIDINPQTGGVQTTNVNITNRYVGLATPSGNSFIWIKNGFATEQDATDFAINWMRQHPNG